MKFHRSFVFPAVVALVASSYPSFARAQTAPVSDSTIVYVGDFDLDVIAYRKPAKKVAPPSTGSAAPTNSADSDDSSVRAARSNSNSSRAKAAEDASTEQAPADRANALLNAVSENLIRALRQAGYHAERLPAGAPIPKVGLCIRGVFAEPDEQNRARRLLIGGVAVSPNMILFVGVSNLGRPEQPLYVLADPPYPDPRHGPVITVTSYAPAARYELSRDPSDDDLKKLSSNITSGLTALLNANPLLSLE